MEGGRGEGARVAPRMYVADTSTLSKHVGSEDSFIFVLLTYIHTYMYKS